MIKDFSKDEYDEFISLFSISNVWHLIKELFDQLEPNLLIQGERAAYLSLRLSEAEKADVKQMRCTVFAALFHDIGSIWSGYASESSPASFDFSRSYDRALSSYLFLKYFSPLRECADIVLFQNGTAAREQKNRYYKDGVRLSLCNAVDGFIVKGMSGPEIAETLLKLRGSVFYAGDVDKMIYLLSDTSLIEEIKSKAYSAELDKFLSSIYFRRDVVRNYLFMITYCLEFYNTETMFHARMTASVCYLMGRYLRLRLHDLCVLYAAGLFGDIGKIGVSRDILEKPGKLTKEEMEQVRQHVGMTRQILSSCIKDKEVIDVACSHHERLDGSGYPLGLKGDQLGLKERIIAIADIASALMAERSYKDAYPMEKTIAELNKMKDAGQLDPKLVDLFSLNQNEIFAYLSNHINRMLRDMQSLRAERQRLRFAGIWQKA